MTAELQPAVHAKSGVSLTSLSSAPSSLGVMQSLPAVPPLPDCQTNFLFLFPSFCLSLGSYRLFHLPLPSLLDVLISLPEHHIFPASTA